MDGESPAIKQFDLERNVITVCYNHPDTPEDITRIVPSNKNEQLQELKARIAGYSQLPASQGSLWRLYCCSFFFVRAESWRWTLMTSACASTHARSS